MLFREVFNMDKIFALDIGTRSIIGVVAELVGDRMIIHAQSRIEHSSRAMYDGQIHDIPKVAKGVAKVKTELEKKLGYKLDQVAIAAAGRSLRTARSRVDQEIDENTEIDVNVVHSLEMMGLQAAQQQMKLKTNNDNNGDSFFCVGHSVVSYYLNGYPIANLLGHSGKTIGADVLATFLPDSVVNSLHAVLRRVGLEPMNMTLEPIAAIDIAIPEDLRTLNLALVDIGAGTSDIAVTRDGSIIAYGMVPMAGDKITEAIIETCLVDFNTAEHIKRKLYKGKDISYVDILGMKNTVSCSNIIEAINPILDQLADNITTEMLRLNGDKSPKTVFCIGGGAQMPKLIEKVSDRLNLSKMRVAVRGRDMLNNLEKIKKDPINGPDGVTVLGIANIALKKTAQDFITVNVNGKDYKLLNFSEITIASVLGLVNYNPRDLIAFNGKNLSFTLNGEKKQIYGELGKPAQITVNGSRAHIQTKVRNADRIKVVKAESGADARLNLGELLNSRNLQHNNYQLMVNKKQKGLDYLIQQGDVVEIMEEQSELPEGMTIPVGGLQLPPEPKGITVSVNGERVVLKGLDNPVFVDIFNFINFDVQKCTGHVEIKVNGEKTTYTRLLSEGDVIEISWEETELLLG